MTNSLTGESRINGKKIATGRILHSINPATEELIGNFSAAGGDEVKQAVEAGREAFLFWKNLPIKGRLAYLSRLRKVLTKKADELATLLALEAGKPLAAGMMEVTQVILIIKYYEANAERILRDEKIPTTFHFMLTFNIRNNYKFFTPMGVIGIISPWNFPLFLSGAAIIPALTAGNACVLKPSEYSSFSTLKFYEAFEEAGFPPGVFNVVLGDGKTGEHLSKADINKICFTGSSETGMAIMKNCADRILPSTLELGGIDAMLILCDCDLEEAANGVLFGTFFNAGQMCAAGKRVLVEKSIKEKFVKKILERTKKLKIGDPLNMNVDIGPLISREQREDFEGFIRDALEKGAKLLYGGKRIEGKGFFHEPTILDGIKMDMKLSYSEPFGPILNIIEFEDDDEAAAIANFPDYALSASIWSRNILRAKKLARQINAGLIMVNDVATISGRTAYGGTKRSGFGRALGAEGLKSLSYQKVMDVFRFSERSRLHWFPYNIHVYNSTRAVLELLFKDGFRGKLKHLFLGVKSLIAQQQEYWKFVKETRL